jgi:hypothetical protein
MEREEDAASMYSASPLSASPLLLGSEGIVLAVGGADLSGEKGRRTRFPELETESQVFQLSLLLARFPNIAL